MVSGIFEAVKKGELDVLEESIRGGASVNQIDHSVHKFTPLHIAGQHSNLQCVEWLLRHGADHSVRSARGWTALHLCAIRGCRKVAQVLLRQGADVMARDLRGCTPGHLATIHDHPNLLHSFISSGHELDCRDGRGWSMAHHACYHGNLSCLRLLNNAPLHQPDLEGNTPLHLACRAGQLACVKQLLSCSVGSWSSWISSKNFHGKTPKREAIEGGRGLVAGYLEALEKQTSSQPSVHEASFPAHLAARTGDLAHLRRLVEGGVVDVAEVDEDGDTLLHKAIGQSSVVEWLLENGANVNTCNNHGESCVEVAERVRDMESCSLMQSHLDGGGGWGGNGNGWGDNDGGGYNDDYYGQEINSR